MNLAEQFHPAPKPAQRNKRTRKLQTSISKKEREKVRQRSGDYCERCGKHRSAVMILECAHVIRRSQGGPGQAWNLIHLCGPSTDSRTCHHWVDYTREGKEWALKFQRERLLKTEG